MPASNNDASGHFLSELLKLVGGVSDAIKQQEFELQKTKHTEALALDLVKALASNTEAQSNLEQSRKEAVRGEFGLTKLVGTILRRAFEDGTLWLTVEQIAKLVLQERNIDINDDTLKDMKAQVSVTLNRLRHASIPAATSKKQDQGPMLWARVA